MIQRLSLDPSVRFNDTGRNLLRLLSLSKIDQNSVDDIVSGLPGHCLAMVTELAHQRSDEWHRFARMLADYAAGQQLLELPGPGSVPAAAPL